VLAELQSIWCRCQPSCGRQRALWSEYAAERDEVVDAKGLGCQPEVGRHAEARWAEQVGDAASCTVAPVMWVELEVSPAFALAEPR